MSYRSESSPPCEAPMQLTRFADYSLRVLMVLAHQQGASTTIREVAEAQGISENHLMKVVHTLGKRGYVKTTRGKGGGISLARDAAGLFSFDVENKA